MLERLTSIDWSAFPQPQSNRPTDVVDAIQRVASASTEAEASTAANTLLSAVGNNHAGTYYPIVLEVVPFLKEILESGGDWARTTVLNVLIDLVDTFEPEAGYETLGTVNGQNAQLAELLRAAVCGIRPPIRRIAASTAADNQQRKLAIELDAVLDPHRAKIPD